VARVAIISPNPANRAGGVERVCAILEEALAAHGWEVEIVGPARPPTTLEFRLGLGYPTMSWTATKAARQSRPDVIVSNGYLGMGTARGIPRVHIYHGTMPGGTRASSDALPLREVLRRSISGGASEAIAGHGAAKVVCVSQATASEVRRSYRVSTDAVIPNAIDTTVFAPLSQPEARSRLGLDPRGRYALFVGRLEHGKGGAVTVEAAGRAGYELLIAGATGAPGAKHLGVLAPAELAHAYAAANCVVLPSLYEACSLVVLEALACGRPLLTTPVGWMGSFLRELPEYRALCVEPNADDVAARLRALDSIETDPLTTAARAFVLEHNSLEPYGDCWHALLESVIGPAQVQRPHPLR
jgi:glycosyltransferase involved in cell wall biosynthesis